MNWNDVKTALSFNDGKVATKPVSLQYKDIGITFSGNHTFDAQLQYQATLDVPATYLGTEVNTLIAQIDDDSLKDLTIPVIANVSGGYTNPKISTDLSSGIAKLTGQLLEIQKQKLVNQGKDKAKSVLGDLLNSKKDSVPSDSTQNSAQNVKEVLGTLLGSKNKDTLQKDSITPNDKTKNAAKNILGGLLGKKKKKDTVN